MKREKIEEGKVINVLLVIIVFPATCEKFTVPAVYYTATWQRGITKSCTASTTCDSDPTRVRGDTVTPTLSKLRGAVESETLVKNVSIQQTPQTP